MSARKRGLGSGLDTLLGVSQEIEQSQEEAAENRAAGHQLETLPVEHITRGQYQPRRYFDEDGLKELAESIRQQGLLQPIVVRQLGKDKYEIVAGERRWRASQLAGLDRIPVIVKQLDDESTMAVALIENLQREDLNPMEEAYALSRLKEEFGLTHEQVAKAVGKSRPAVSNFLRLTSLSEPVRQMVENTDLDMGHARALLALEGKDQLSAARAIIEKQMSARQAEELVRGWGKKATGKKKQPAKADPDVQRLQQNLSEKLGAEVQIQAGATGRGKLVIKYNSNDELEGILKHIR